MSPANDLVDILDEVEDAAAEDGAELGTILDHFDSRNYGPLLLVPALVAVSPIGAIPGMSIITGSVIILIAGQLLLKGGKPWIPQRLAENELPPDKVEQTVEATRPWAEWLDRFLQPRLTFMLEPPMTHVFALLCIALATTFYPLALLPFAVALPGAAICVLSIGLATRDGAVVLAGYALSGVTAWLTYTYWPF